MGRHVKHCATTRSTLPSQSRRWALPTVVALVLTLLLPGRSTAATDTDSWGFDTDPVGAVPAGCAPSGTSTAAVVSDARSTSGSNSLRVYDPASTAQTTLTCAGRQRQGAHLSADVFPAALPNGFTFSLLGKRSGETADSAVFHFNVTADGTVRWYDGGGWTAITGPHTVPVGRWTHLDVDIPSDMERTHLYVDGQYVGDGGPWGVGKVTAVNGFQVAGNGTAPSGDDVYVDTVRLGDSQDAQPPLHNAVEIGDRTIIDSDDAVIQMPGTTFRVPDSSSANGYRTLVGYSGHPDDSHTSGWRISASKDDGATWFLDQQRNPDPTSASMNVAKLPNGDLFVAAYHTYMVDGSNNTAATIPGAVSHDNGKTWEHFTATMTTPQPMRNISSSTDWPGHPLGGFVLMPWFPVLDDGTMLASAYGYYAVDAKYRQILLASKDGGHTWTVRSTIATPQVPAPAGGYEGPCEGAIVRAADGSLVAVMRTGSYRPMLTARSTDDGRTWSTPTELTGASGRTVSSVNPQLTLLGNGTLLLQMGRPGLQVMTSLDGSGRSWTDPDTVDYRNSANGRFQPVGVDRVLSFGDAGANWSSHRTGQYQIWSRPVAFDSRCEKVITGPVDEPVTVDGSGTCLRGASVDAPVVVRPGGRLIVTDSTITGPVRSDGADLVTICGSRIDGPVLAWNSHGAVTVGDKTRACAPNRITGPVSTTGSRGLVVVDPVTGPTG